MNTTFYTLGIAVLIVLGSCQKSSEHHDADAAHDATEESPNRALYEEVMAIHDEVMPKMNDIYTLQQKLKSKLTTAPAEEKQELEILISELDSASNGMMVWMRQFDPIPDSVSVEKARLYLENEKVKVEQVKKDMLEAIEKASQFD